MKNFFKKLGFRKMDEMEQLIAFKAQRNALLFLVLALFVWTLYESYKVYAFEAKLNLFPCFLLVAGSLIQTVSGLVMSRNAVKGDDEYYESSPVLKIILVILVTAAITATGVVAIIFYR